jgi:hypothetical protein
MPIIKVFAALALTGIVGKLFSFFGPPVPLFPNSVFSLDLNWWYAMAFTGVASILVYFIALSIGYIVGMLAGIAYLSGEFIGIKTIRISLPFHVIYNFLYITPFAITASITYTLAFKLRLRLISTGILLLIVAAISLPGYKIFKSIYSAISSAKEDNKYLCESLFIPTISNWSRRIIPPRIRKMWILARRLRDCEYQSFNESTIDAFHLSVISVVIIEMIVPNFYEYFFPSVSYQPYYGGVGRMIINAQQSLTWEQIFGILWVLLLWDWFCTQIITIVNYRLRDRYYQTLS